MGKFKVVLTRKKRFWRCPKNVKISVITPNKKTIRRNQKKSKKMARKISQMNVDEKKELLLRKGLIKSNSSIPEHLMDVMLKSLVI
tara:strand:- start:2913 stop:3170 length:258 start_codon:yes stop_codon:yes gene_type:complete